jgi:dephospho-CoA kinase
MPSQQRKWHSRTEPLFVGLAGRIGAGKTSAAEYLSSKYRFQYARYSLVLQEWLSPDTSDRDRLQKLGWDIMSGGLQVELNSRLIAALDHSRSAVIDGLRHPIDFDSLASTFGSSFRIIFLEAPPHARFERLRSRFSTFDEFYAADVQPVEQNIDILRPLADVTIPNEGSIESLYQHLDTCMTESVVGDRR